MKKYAFYLLIVSIAITSCKKDEETVTPVTPTPTNISITADDFGVIGADYYHKTDSTNVDTISFAAVGGLVDLSMLTADFSDTSKFRDPNDYEVHTNFPEANLALDGDGDVVMFIKKTTEKIEMVGIYTKFDTIDIIIPFTNYLTMFEFPFTVGDTLSDSGEGETTINYNFNGFNIPITLSFEIQKNSKIESQVNVKSPYSTASCLKEFSTNINTFTMSPDLSGNGPQIDTTNTYSYFAKGKGDVFIEAQLDANKKATQIKYLEE